MVSQMMSYKKLSKDEELVLRLLKENLNLIVSKIAKLI